jgi:hypothetical protein
MSEYNHRHRFLNKTTSPKNLSCMDAFSVIPHIKIVSVTLTIQLYYVLSLKRFYETIYPDFRYSLHHFFSL